MAQEVYLTREHLCVVMELAEGGDLAQRMEELHHYGVWTAFVNHVAGAERQVAWPCDCLPLSTC